MSKGNLKQHGHLAPGPYQSGNSPALLLKSRFDRVLHSDCTGCTNTHVTPFRIEIQLGLPIVDQIVYAATRAIVAGQMRPGDAFPSVRALSKELRINPNTAAKAVTELINAGLLEMHPGVGTVVAIPPRATPEERTALLGRQIEELVVEARRLGIPEQELLRAVSAHYGRLNPKKQPTGGKDRI